MPTVSQQMGDDVRKKVWNNTNKAFRMPNNQAILPRRSGNISGWDVWKDDDVVKSWLSTGALTEDEPLSRGGGERLSTFTTPLSPAPSVFSGIIEPPTKPGAARETQEGTSGASYQP